MFNSAGQAIRSWLGCLRYLHGAGRCGKKPMGDLSSLRVMDEDQAEQYLKLYEILIDGEEN